MSVHKVGSGTCRELDFVGGSNPSGCHRWSERKRHAGQATSATELGLFTGGNGAHWGLLFLNSNFIFIFGEGEKKGGEREGAKV